MHPLLREAEQRGQSRRVFLRNLLLSAGSVSTAHWLTACNSGGRPLPGAPNPGNPDAGGGLLPPRRSPFADMGPLLAADENGVQLPAGFSSRVIAVFGEPPIPSNPGFIWPADPDGAGMFRTDDGGWIYVSNSEARDITTLFGALPDFPVVNELATRDSLEVPNAVLGPISGQLPLAPPLILPFSGGASALRFDAEGNLVDAYPILRNTSTNCSGGVTPWGTWINGEEILDGYMFECSPLRDGGEPVRLDRFGRKAHEQVALDVDGRAIYHTEDLGGDERFYRTIFASDAWPRGQRPDMDRGVLQALVVEGGIEAARAGPTPIRWIDAVDDGTPQFQVYQDETEIFSGNEGCWFLEGFVFFSTKSDDNIWAIDTFANTIESIYDPVDGPIGSPVDPDEPQMFGVDNITMTLDGEMIVVEDGGDLRAMVLLPDRSTIPLLRLPGDPSVTEVTGPAFSPDGRRLYVASQRALRNGQPRAFGSGGVIYEISLPFAVRVNPPMAGRLA